MFCTDYKIRGLHISDTTYTATIQIPKTDASNAENLINDSVDYYLKNIKSYIPVLK